MMNASYLRLMLMMALSGVLVAGLAACGDDGGDGMMGDDDDDDMMVGDDDDDDMMVGDDDDDDDDDEVQPVCDTDGEADEDGFFDCVLAPEDEAVAELPFDDASFNNTVVADAVVPVPGDDDPLFVLPDGDPNAMGGTPPAPFDTSATYRGADAPGTATDDLWWNPWVTFTGDDTCPEGNTEVSITADITSDTTWTSDNCYVLDEQIFVSGASADNPTVLTIEPGTFITGGDEGDALIITTTGQIDAQGTPEEPIIFTSNRAADDRNAGDWGGVVLLGLGELNTADPTQVVEGLPPGTSAGEYGGSDNTHNCGTLEYVRIEHAGFPISSDNELNGLTAGGCGSDTTISFVEVFNGQDDGIEFFGGRVSADHTVVVNQGDDGYDFDQGWQGGIQFAVGYNAVGDRNNEWDNNSNGRRNEPFTTPTVWNGTYVGVSTGQECFRLREGVRADINNVICQDFADDQCVEVQHLETLFNVNDGSLTVSDSLFANCETAFRFSVGDSCMADADCVPFDVTP
ncbi:MAG TPA: hypothetical protein RMF84_05265 [Polyangiaceae bacterium LLY-WYZ-14_1]|nr:hypothetical protein [Polyangiaceae bacterium LLY-WYZ-14_1]